MFKTELNVRNGQERNKWTLLIWNCLLNAIVELRDLSQVKRKHLWKSFEGRKRRVELWIHQKLSNVFKFRHLIRWCQELIMSVQMILRVQIHEFQSQGHWSFFVFLLKVVNSFLKLNRQSFDLRWHRVLQSWVDVFNHNSRHDTDHYCLWVPQQNLLSSLSSLIFYD